MQWKLSTSRQSVQSELSAMPRGDLTKNQWNYIKQNKLQQGREKEDSDQRRRRAESCLWWQEAGQHVQDDQTRLWACKIGAIPSGDCLGRQKLTIPCGPSWKPASLEFGESSESFLQSQGGLQSTSD
jgi:hypothetical protein